MNSLCDRDAAELKELQYDMHSVQKKVFDDVQSLRHDGDMASTLGGIRLRRHISYLRTSSRVVRVPPPRHYELCTRPSPTMVIPTMHSQQVGTCCGTYYFKIVTYSAIYFKVSSTALTRGVVGPGNVSARCRCRSPLSKVITDAWL